MSSTVLGNVIGVAGTAAKTAAKTAVEAAVRLAASRTGIDFGYLIAQASIDRSEAAAYLAGARNLNNFYDMVISGALQYQTPNDFIPYQGTPNHPMFMLPSAAAASSWRQCGLFYPLR